MIYSFSGSRPAYNSLVFLDYLADSPVQLSKATTMVAIIKSGAHASDTPGQLGWAGLCLL